MATVIFIKESKQTPSAMRGCINYCVQEKKTVDENGRQYVGGVNCLGQHAYEEFMATKIFTAKHRALTSISMCSPFCRGKFSPMRKPTALVWNLPGSLFRDTRFWSPRIWMHMTTAAFREYTTILLSIRSASRTAGRFTSRPTPYRSFGKSAMTSAVTTVCLFCRRRSAETVRASVRGSTVQR